MVPNKNYILIGEVERCGRILAHKSLGLVCCDATIQLIDLVLDINQLIESEPARIKS